MTPDFSKAQEEATKLLLKQDNFNSLSIDVRNFTFDKNILIDSIQHYADVVGKKVSDFTCSESSGCWVLKDFISAFNIILYDNDEKNEERKHWGITHEIGHIYLNHTSDGDKQEIEANFFTAQILMPESVLRHIVAYKGRLTAEEIYEDFNVSFEAAQKRVHTLNKNQYFYDTHNDENKALINKFKPVIEKRFTVSKPPITIRIPSM